MARPWEQAEYHGRMRASDADRDRAADALEAACRQGLLTDAEFRVRTGQVHACRTYAELTAVTAVPATRLPPGPPARRITPKVVAGSAGTIVLLPAIVAAFLDTYYGGFIILCLLACAGLMVSGNLMAPRRSGPGS